MSWLKIYNEPETSATPGQSKTVAGSRVVDVGMNKREIPRQDPMGVPLPAVLKDSGEHLQHQADSDQIRLIVFYKEFKRGMESTLKIPSCRRSARPIAGSATSIEVRWRLR